MGSYDGELTDDQVAFLREQAAARRKRWRLFPDKPLGKPVRDFDDTFSAQDLLMEHFFPNTKPSK